MITDAPALAARPGEHAFFGHPRGLAYLAFTECWERFSYYGMTALLTLYMLQQLFLPGHVENVLALVVCLAGQVARVLSADDGTSGVSHPSELNHGERQAGHLPLV